MFLIPEKYSEPLFLLFLLREKIEEWSILNVRKEFRKAVLRDPDMLNQYHNMKNEISDIEQFLVNSRFKFVLKTAEGLKVYGTGPEILFEEKTRRLYDSKTEFFGLPKGVNRNLVTAEKILEAVGFKIPEKHLSIWSGRPMCFDLIWALEESYDLEISVWQKIRSATLNRFLYKNHYISDNDGLKIILHYQEETEQFFLVEDEKEYFRTLFVCRNDEECDFRFRTEKLRNEHEKRCGKERMQIVQEELGPVDKLIRKAEEHGLIPKLNYNRNFLFYDIESLLPSCDIRTQKTTALSTHVLVSLAANR